jgi:hypothetical protein
MMKVELSPEEVHALIEFHDDQAGWSVMNESEVEDRKRSKARADDLYFMLTGAKRKSQSTSFAVKP